jgi:LysM repeat protein
MNRRQLAFLVLLNTVVSLVVALGVVWAFEARRPDLEELAAIYTPRPEAILAAPATQAPVVAAQPTPPTTTETIAETPTATPESASQAEEIYIVQPGDTLLVVATRYGIAVDDILRANNLSNPDYVFSGQRLVIPVQGASAAPAGAAPTDTAGGEPEVQGVAVAAVSGAGDLANEQVIVANEGELALTLQGWQVTREGGPAYTFGNVSLFPGGSVRLRSGAGTDTTADLFWNQPAPVWQSGAIVRLLNTQGNVVSSYTVP